MPKDFLQGASLKYLTIYITISSWYATHKSCSFIFYSQITARAQKKRFAQLATNVPLTSMGMEYPAGCISRTGRSSTSTRSMQSTSRRRRLMEARRVRTTRSRLWQSRKLCKIPVLLFNLNLRMSLESYLKTGF